jgi:hypothetical protein
MLREEIRTISENTSVPSQCGIQIYRLRRWEILGDTIDARQKSVHMTRIIAIAAILG